MRPNRQLKPLVPLPLEGRVVPSHVAALQRSVDVGAGASTTAAGLAGTSIVDVDRTLQAGIPVHLRRTTIYPDGTSKVTDELIVPNGNNTVTTIDRIALPGHEGTETEVSVQSLNGNTSTTHWIYYEADGSTQTEISTAVTTGRRSHISEILNEPDGSVESVTGTSVEVGPVTVLEKNYVGANGKRHHYGDITIHHGLVNEDITVTTWPHSAMNIEKTTTTEVRLPLPTA